MAPLVLERTTRSRSQFAHLPSSVSFPDSRAGSQVSAQRPGARAGRRPAHHHPSLCSQHCQRPQKSTSVTPDEPTLTCHSRPNSTAHPGAPPGSCAFPESGRMHDGTCPSPQYRPVLSLPEKSMPHRLGPSPPRLATTDAPLPHSDASSRMSQSEHPARNPPEWRLPPGQVHVGFSMSFYDLLARFFSVLDDNPLAGWTTVYSSITC